MKNTQLKKLQTNISEVPAPDYTLIPIQSYQISEWVNLQIRCWQETYSSMNLFYLEELVQYKEEWAVEKQKIFEDPNAYKVFLFWKGKPVGFCEAGKPRHFSYKEEYYFMKNIFVKGEITRIYILKDHQGKGLGRQLFLSATRWLQQTDQLPFRVWVFTQNIKANIFYQKMNAIKEKEALLDVHGQIIKATAYCFFV